MRIVHESWRGERISVVRVFSHGKTRRYNMKYELSFGLLVLLISKCNVLYGVANNESRFAGYFVNGTEGLNPPSACGAGKYVNQ